MEFVIITYQVDRWPSKVREQLLKKGYMKYLINKEQIYYLPNTILWKKEGTTNQAIQDIESVFFN